MAIGVNFWLSPIGYSRETRQARTSTIWPLKISRAFWIKGSFLKSSLLKETGAIFAGVGAADVTGRGAALGWAAGAGIGAAGAGAGGAAWREERPAGSS